MSDDEFDIAGKTVRRAIGVVGAGVRRILARPAAAAPAAQIVPRHRDVSSTGCGRLIKRQQNATAFDHLNRLHPAATSERCAARIGMASSEKRTGGGVRFTAEGILNGSFGLDKK